MYVVFVQGPRPTPVSLWAPVAASVKLFVLYLFRSTRQVSSPGEGSLIEGLQTLPCFSALSSTLKSMVRHKDGLLISLTLYCYDFGFEVA